MILRNLFKRPIEKVNGLDNQQLTEIKDQFITFDDKFENFTKEVIGCLINNFESIAKKLDSKPCDANMKIIKKLSDNMDNHDKRIVELEENVYEIKKKIEA